MTKCVSREDLQCRPKPLLCPQLVATGFTSCTYAHSDDSDKTKKDRTPGRDGS